MSQKPYVSSEKTLPEITIKSFFLGVILSMVLAAANTYLGLFAGMTVSASIPAAVISMSLLKLFKKHNILENNAVQTAASAGESLAAGVIFTFPALILMGYWTKFNYFETTLIALSGGILGVLFTVPLRKALIVDQELDFPEGLATAEVLKSAEGNKKDSFKTLLTSAAIGSVFKFLESGAKIWQGVLDKAALVKGKYFFYFGINLSPALMAVGYIVGLNIATVVFIGGCLSWFVAIPVYIYLTGNPNNLDAVSLGYSVWNSQIRFLGVGGMIVGGLWALFSIRHSLKKAIVQGLQAFSKQKQNQEEQQRTQKDLPMNKIFIGIAFMILPIFFIYYDQSQILSVAGIMAITMVITGFLFSAVAGYMSGLVGSSNNPVSGVTISTLLLSSLLLLGLFTLLDENDFSKGAALAIMIGAVVCCASAIASDNMQDLKAGYILGATPYKQQIMQIVGVISAAIVMAPVLTLLNTAYGFGPKTAQNPDALSAPQASLMQSVAEGVFGKGLPWTMIAMGALIGVIAILIDESLKKNGSKIKVPVLALSIGIYLPFELDSSLWVGGILAHLICKFQNRFMNHKNFQTAKTESDQSGLLFASGLITGEAIIGILLAIPVAVFGNSKVLALLDKPLIAEFGLVLFFGVVIYFYKLIKSEFQNQMLTTESKNQTN